MPPTRSQNRRKLTEQEGRILLAIQAIEKQKKLSIRAAARIYDIPHTTLYARLRGRPNRVDLRANSFKLTEIEENSLEKWVISMDTRGAAPRPYMVQDMANLLLATRGSTPVQTVGVNWVAKFVKRHPELDIRFSRRLNYERARCEDPKIIIEWFELVKKTIYDYGIDPDDIYNFDETGFAMGLATTAKVVTRAEYYGRRFVLEAGNREWVTSIECTGASGYILPPMVIFKGKMLIGGWANTLPGDWQFQVSPNGWTSDEIGLRWLEKVFLPSTFSRMRGKYRLLVLDGHGSHLTPKFDQICSQNDVIPICMPPHSSHLLQPLDVGCFAVLKRAYGKYVDSVVRLGQNHIDKLDFLDAFPTARIEAFKAEIIKSSFAATGLVPYDPNRVISKLSIQLYRTPTPPPSRDSQRSASWEPKTPSNFMQLQKQATSIKKLLKQRSKSPPSPLNSAINQVLKACQITMQSTAFLARENELLRARNEKIKLKKSRSRVQISAPEGLSVAELRELAQNDKIHGQTIEPTSQAEVQNRPPRALPKCSNCGIQGHKRTHCPNLVK